MKTRRSSSQISFGTAVLAALVSLLVMECAVEVARAQPQLCLTQVTGLPKLNPSPPPTWIFPNTPPQIPGVSCSGSACPLTPEADTGWFNAFRYTLETGTNVLNQPTDGAFQAIAQGSKMYYAFEINNVSAVDGPSAYDTVILGFDNRGGLQAPSIPQQYTWIVISGPFEATPSSTPQGIPASNILVFQGSNSNPATWTSIATPSWIQAGTSGSIGGGLYSWWVVVSIDKSGPQLAPNGKFGAYLEAIRADFVTFHDNWNVFPNSAGPVVNSNPDAGNPAPAAWATATTDPGAGCSGVFIQNWDISNNVGSSPTSVISWTQPNTFKVNVHNSGADAPQVTATFKIANFGLPAPNEWLPLGTNVCGLTPQPAGCGGGPHPNDSVANNPSTTGADVAAAVTTPTGSCMDGTGNMCTTIATGTWSLGTDNVAYYSQPNNQHECVRVDLNSLVGTTTFINNSSWNNFDFSATASRFHSRAATVSANYMPVGAGNQQTFDLKVSKVPMTAAVAQSLLSRAKRPGPTGASYLTFIVDGCRLSGKSVTIQGPLIFGQNGRPLPRKPVTFQNCDSVGSYGYVIRHDRAVDRWQYNLAASGNGVSMKVSQKDPDQYTLVVPQGQKAQLVAVVTTGGCGKMGLDIGVFLMLGGMFVVGVMVYCRRESEG
jgi:hypothetical protein